MKSRRLSQDAVAQALGVSQGLVSGWCRAKYVPDIFQGRELARLLKVSLDLLVDEESADVSLARIEADCRVREIVGEIGPERAWRKLIRGEDSEGSWNPEVADQPAPNIPKEKRG